MEGDKVDVGTVEVDAVDVDEDMNVAVFVKLVEDELEVAVDVDVAVEVVGAVEVELDVLPEEPCGYLTGAPAEKSSHVGRQGTEVYIRHLADSPSRW